MKKIIALIVLVSFLSFGLFACTKEEEKETIKYNVTFLDKDGNELKVETVEEGKSATSPTTPTVEGFTFKEWDNDFSNVTGDLTVKAIYEQNKYTVRYYDDLDHEIYAVDVKYGEKALEPTAPTKEGHTFTGWDKDISNVTSDLNVKAQFTKNEYTVKFYSDNTLISEAKVLYKESAVAPTDPIKEGYTFTGWDKEFNEVTGDIEINATFEIIKYTVKFYLDDELLAEVEFNYGEQAKFNSTPIKTGYLFTGWDKEDEMASLKSNLETKAVFEIETYTITYYYGNKKLTNLEPKTYTINDLVFLPDYELEGYEFLGWYPSQTSNEKIASLNFGETGNKVFYAKVEKLEEEKILVAPEGATFVFENIKKVAHSSGNGTYVYQPDFSKIKGTAPSTSVLKYTWESLDPTVATISAYSSISIASSGYCIIKCTYVDNTSIFGYAVIKTTPDGVFASTIEEANNRPVYTVKFVDYDGKEISSVEVESGKTAQIPELPVHEGKTFIGWDKDHYNITSDVTITAQYQDGTNYFVNKKVSILGDSITTYKGYVPDGYACFYPYPTADVADVNQTWWMNLVNKLGMQLVKNNSWSGSCVSSGTGSSAAVNDSRLQELVDGTIKPDIIIIYMGTNDCASQYVSLDQFKSSYKIMLDKIKALCPDAEIYLCTLCASGLCKAQARAQYNKVITDYASEYELPIIDFDKIWTDDTYSQYVVDSGHPNRSGMTKYTEQAIVDMLAYKNGN